MDNTEKIIINAEFASEAPVNVLLENAEAENLRIDLLGEKTIDGLRKSIRDLRQTIKVMQKPEEGVIAIDDFWKIMKSTITNLRDKKVLEFFTSLNLELGKEINIKQDEKKNQPNDITAKITLPPLT
ncbi:MAG: hypothetical protein AAB467_03470 [Patescibacteria group bacterium]